MFIVEVESHAQGYKKEVDSFPLHATDEVLESAMAVRPKSSALAHIQQWIGSIRVRNQRAVEI